MPDWDCHANFHFLLSSKTAVQVFINKTPPHSRFTSVLSLSLYPRRIYDSILRTLDIYDVHLLVFLCSKEKLIGDSREEIDHFEHGHDTGAYEQTHSSTNISW